MVPLYEIMNVSHRYASGEDKSLIVHVELESIPSGEDIDIGHMDLRQASHLSQLLIWKS